MLTSRQISCRTPLDPLVSVPMSCSEMWAVSSQPGLVSTSVFDLHQRVNLTLSTARLVLPFDGPNYPIGKRVTFLP